MRNIDKNQAEYKNLTILSRDEIVEAYEKGKLCSYVWDEAIRVEKDDDGEITHIIFANGGPIVYLDFDEQPGIIIAKDLDTKAQSAIPWSIWCDIRDELEEIYEQ